MKNEIACGSIVIKNNKVLIIKRNKNFYEFPKGHIEKNETYIQTAIREVKEETNIDIKILSEKQYTMSFLLKNKINKKVILFISKPLNDNLKIQEEELEDAKWVKIDDVYDILTYNDLKLLWKEALIDIRKDFK